MIQDFMSYKKSRPKIIIQLIIKIFVNKAKELFSRPYLIYQPTKSLIMYNKPIKSLIVYSPGNYLNLKYIKNGDNFDK